AAGPEPRPVPQDRRPARADAPVERDPGLPGEPRPDLPLRLTDRSRGGEARTGIRAAPHRRMGGAPALEVPGLRSWCWVRVSVPVAVTAVVTAGAGVALVVVTVDVGAGVAEGRVEQADDVDGVPAQVQRHVDRDLDGVAGQDAGRADRLALGARVRHGSTGPGQHHGTRAESDTGRLRDARHHVL